jgi:hypothetical protein
MSKQPRYLNLDAITPEREIVIKVFGEEHKMRPTTVGDFIKNVQTLRRDPDDKSDAASEFEATAEILIRAFPSLTKEIISELTLAQMKAIVDFAQRADTSDEVQEDDGADANPQTAG